MKELHDILILLLSIYNKKISITIDNKEALHYIKILLDNNYISLENNYYQLNKPPKECTIREIIDMFHLQILDIPCLNDSCIYDDCCSCLCFWYGLKKQIESYYDMYTLDDLRKGCCIE